MNTLPYAQALAQQRTAFCVHIYPFGGHGFTSVDGQTNGPLKPQTILANEWTQKARKWLRFTLQVLSSPVFRGG